MKFQAIAVVLIYVCVTGCDNTTKMVGGGSAGKDDKKVEKPFKAEAAAEAQARAALQTFTEEFTVEAVRNKGLSDIGWFVDTSGSMTQEISLIKSNISHFITKIKAISDARMGMFVRKSGYVSGDFTAEFAGHEDSIKQFDAMIESYDSLLYAASSLCPAGSTTTNTLCGQPQDFIPTSAVQHSGSLQGFFREESSKILVFVTDDKSTFSAEKFREALPPGLDLTVFAFAVTAATQGTTTCTPENPGTVYQELATSTGGKVYDICQPDWRAHFDDLIKQVDSIVSEAVKLKHSPEKVLSVTLDGALIGKDFYSIKGKRISVKEEILGDTNQVKVVYQARP